MKKTLATLLLSAITFQALASETWRKETYESGESVYHSGFWNAFNSQLVLGERGVSFAYMSPNGKYSALGLCTISIDGSAEENCEFVTKDSRMLMTGNNLFNRLANAKAVKLKVRICRAGACYFAVNGGTTEEVEWEWDEPLSTTFPDFKPYPVKK